MSKEREDLFFAFAKRAFASGIVALVEKDSGATLVKELFNAFDGCYPEEKSNSLPSFEHAEFHHPFVAYVIHNRATHRAYVGSALDGFNKRYPRGWWRGTSGSKEHHNEALRDDVLIYGVNGFQVRVYVCEDEEHMQQLESQLIAQHRSCTYNIRAEPTVKR